MRIAHLLPVTLLAASLGACGGTQNRGLESVHQPIVSRTDYVYDVAQGGGREMTQRLSAWFKSLNIGYGDRIAIDDPTGSGANRAVVASVADQFGLLLERTAPVTSGSIPMGMFRVVVSRSKAEVPGCPDWSRSSRLEFNGDMPSNYGCASNSNLAAMVANPEDLVAGRRSGGVADTTTGGNAIRKIKEPK